MWASFKTECKACVAGHHCRQGQVRNNWKVLTPPVSKLPANWGDCGCCQREAVYCWTGSNFSLSRDSFPKSQGITGLKENANLGTMQCTEPVKAGFSAQLTFPFGYFWLLGNGTKQKQETSISTQFCGYRGSFRETCRSKKPRESSDTFHAVTFHAGRPLFLFNKPLPTDSFPHTTQLGMQPLRKPTQHNAELSFHSSTAAWAVTDLQRSSAPKKLLEKKGRFYNLEYLPPATTTPIPIYKWTFVYIKVRGLQSAQTVTHK